ncbi:MAG: CDP-diacylglycerol--serine O-phosphatidyltransferase [Muribaculaceae bacterium]|nr:CDP-diacylglycerol--serine O-phosphatidyltransferase [Muribaculaceae bacterium]
MIRRIISCIPNSITCLNLLSGCMAIIMAFHYSKTMSGLTGAQWTCIFIGLAAIFDFCDGASARLLHAYSDTGKELDSLADLVSFGVAPAMLIFNLMHAYSNYDWLCYAALFIPAMGALRLARFNVDDSQATTFKGLPIPGNAIFWIGVYGYGYPGTAAMVIMIVLVSLAMVSNIKMFSLKFKNFDIRENFRRYVIILATIAFVVFYGLSGLAWTIVLYMLISVMSRRKDI